MVAKKRIPPAFDPSVDERSAAVRQHLEQVKAPVAAKPHPAPRIDPLVEWRALRGDAKLFQDLLVELLEKPGHRSNLLNLVVIMAERVRDRASHWKEAEDRRGGPTAG